MNLIEHADAILDAIHLAPLSNRSWTNAERRGVLAACQALHDEGTRAGIEAAAHRELGAREERAPQKFSVPEPKGVEATLAERGAHYGDFTDLAKICDALIGIAEANSAAVKVPTSWDRMKPFQRQAVRVIMEKLARILSGDPDYVDNWHDLQGYAKLVEDRLVK